MEPKNCRDEVEWQLAKLSINSTVRLNNGMELPVLGFGTLMLKGKDAFNSVHWALEKGYRLVDTASVYENESEVGRAIAESGLNEKAKVTTKLWISEFSNPLFACMKSLKRLRKSHVDLYLVHWPIEGNAARLNVWREMEKIYENGLCRAIGVSNFNARQLEELLEHCDVVPAVNQVEFSPFLYQKELLGFCKKNKIQLEAYRRLARGEKLKDKRLVAIAANYGKSPAQILIRWSLQHGIVVIPKSKHKERIIENADVFDFKISSKDMAVLNSFQQSPNFKQVFLSPK